MSAVKRQDLMVDLIESELREAFGFRLSQVKKLAGRVAGVGMKPEEFYDELRSMAHNLRQIADRVDGLAASYAHNKLRDLK